MKLKFKDKNNEPQIKLEGQHNLNLADSLKRGGLRPEPKKQDPRYVSMNLSASMYVAASYSIQTSCLLVSKFDFAECIAS